MPFAAVFVLAVFCWVLTRYKFLLYIFRVGTNIFADVVQQTLAARPVLGPRHEVLCRKPCYTNGIGLDLFCNAPYDRTFHRLSLERKNERKNRNMHTSIGLDKREM